MTNAHAGRTIVRVRSVMVSTKDACLSGSDEVNSINIQLSRMLNVKCRSSFKTENRDDSKPLTQSWLVPCR